MTNHAQFGKCEKCNSPLYGIVTEDGRVLETDCQHCYQEGRIDHYGLHNCAENKK